MFETVKGWLKVYSIIVLMILIIRMFFKCGNKKFEIAIKYSMESASLIPVIIYLLNI